jgi:hypothetical protein
MIIKVKEKQKYLKVYDIDMNLIGSFYTIKEAAKYINVEEMRLWSAKKRGSLLFGNYYIKTEGPVFIEHTKEIDSYTVIRNHTKCSKCGVVLCSKNEWLNKSKGTTKNRIRNYKCKNCIRNNNKCLVKYDNPVLEKLSKKQYFIIHNKFYHKSFSIDKKESRKKDCRNRAKQNRVILTDSIIITDLLACRTIKTALGRRIKKEEITPSMMEAKKKSILLTRKLKQKV